MANTAANDSWCRQLKITTDAAEDDSCSSRSFLSIGDSGLGFSPMAGTLRSTPATPQRATNACRHVTSARPPGAMEVIRTNTSSLNSSSSSLATYGDWQMTSPCIQRSVSRIRRGEDSDSGVWPFMSADGSPDFRDCSISSADVSLSASPPSLVSRQIDKLRLHDDPSCKLFTEEDRQIQRTEAITPTAERSAVMMESSSPPARFQSPPAFDSVPSPLLDASRGPMKRRRLLALSPSDDPPPHRLFSSSPSPRPYHSRGGNRRDKILESAGRYKQEFNELELVGSGQYGAVFKCRNHIDGTVYAVKKSRQPMSGSCLDEAALREAHTHSLLQGHLHVVRYYSAWLERRHLFIQFEFCNGGSLQGAIESGCMFVEKDIRQIILQVARGLHHIHSHNIVHLDIKPGNIFLCEGPLQDCPSFSTPMSSISHSPLVDMFSPTDQLGFNHGMSTPASHSSPKQLGRTYKIGDFGHAVSVSSGEEFPGGLEEGDCRYLTREVLNEDMSDLFKADVFALALTAYEAAGGGPLPMNGDLWHLIRDGHLQPLPHLSKDLMNLLACMIKPNQHIRPSAFELTIFPLLQPTASQSTQELRAQLNAARFENEVLNQQLAILNSNGKERDVLCRLPPRRHRAVGRGALRSMSMGDIGLSI